LINIPTQNQDETENSFDSFGSIDCTHPLVILNPFDFTEQQDNSEIEEVID
jgi:hypothetical protein